MKLVIFLSVLMIFSGCLDSALEQGLQGVCTGFDSYDDAFNCYISLANETGNINYCENMTYSGGHFESMYMEKCYIIIASKTGNISICDKIKPYFTGTQYGTWRIEDRSGECYNVVALNRMDFSICEDMPVEYKPGCYVQFNHSFDHVLCDAAKAEVEASNSSYFKYSDECYLYLAIEDENISLCVKIEGYETSGSYGGANVDDKRVVCFEHFMNISQDPSICEVMPEKFRVNCYEHFNVHFNATLCKSIDAKSRDDYTLVQDCLFKVAQDYKNLSLCGEITDNYWIWSCYNDVSAALNDSSICEQIPEKYRLGCNMHYEKIFDKVLCNKTAGRIQDYDTTGMRIICLIYLINRTDDLSYCEAEDRLLDEEVCFNYLTNRMENPLDCMNGLDLLVRDDCYLKMLNKTGDKTLCDKIYPETRPKICN